MTTYQLYYGTVRALLIGIDNYQDARLTPLGEAEHDAQLMAETLSAAPYGFQLETLLGAEATRRNIAAALGDLARDAAPDDLLLVYYSGHGEPLHNNACLIPYDASQEDFLSVIPLEQLTLLYRRTQARHVGFIFDACFSARVMGIVERQKSTAPAEKLLERRTYMALSAAAGLADDVQSMTRFLLEELGRSTVDETTGLLTFTDLGNRVRAGMLAELGKKQIPQLGHLPDSEGGDIILTGEAGPRLPRDLMAALASDSGYIRWGAVAELIEIVRRGGELTPLALEWLERLAREDPDERVRGAAQSYFDEQAAIRSGEEERIREEELERELAAIRQRQAEAEEARLRAEEARQITPVPLSSPPPVIEDAPAAASEPLIEHEPETPTPSFEEPYAPAATLSATPSPSPRARLRQLPWKWVGVGVAVILCVTLVVAIILSRPTLLLFGLGFPRVSTPNSSRAAEATSLAQAGVTQNADWSPYIEEINGVPMALVPAGCFPMGSEEGGDDQRPVHEVCFDDPFWIDVYEVTQAEYTFFGSNALIVFRGRFPQRSTSWSSASSFCQMRGARLPTEAEWEYAARSPDGLVYPWGNEFITDNVVYSGNSRSHPWNVGSKSGGISWVGALDLSGNVREWVKDWYDSGYYGTLADGVVNPQGPTSGEDHVLRGGTWSDESDFLRGADRIWRSPDNTSGWNGFRCALSYRQEVSSTTSAPTLAPTDAIAPPGFIPVTSNADWEPIIEEKNGVQMALVPAGCFMMGSEEGNSDESPVHEVCFEEPFWIDVYEVTNEQYGEAAAAGCLSYSSDDRQPRVCINWTDSLAYCEARGARLPTEAEWEYAARGPDGLAFPWGDEFDGTLANFCDQNCTQDWADKTVDDGHTVTAPVGSYPGGVSWVGAFDLSGNVWEWVNDWYDGEYYGTLADGVVNPQGPNSGEYRVLQGGSWVDYDGDLRGAARGRLVPSAVDGNYGVRCALSN